MHSIRPDSIRSDTQVRKALKRCGKMLVLQRCDIAGWRAIICSSPPDTSEERFEIEMDADRHLADVCRRTQKEAMAVALGQIGWTTEHLSYAEVRHDLEVDEYGSCVFNDDCPVCAMSQP